MQENKETNDTSNTPIDTTIEPAPTVETASEVVADTAPAVSETVATPVVETPAPVVETVVPTDVPEATVPVASEAPVASSADDSVKKQMLKQYGIATLIILIMGAGLAYALEQQGRISTGVFDKITAVVSPEPAAAVVNGTKITVADYEKNLAQLQSAAAAQGADVESEAIQAEIKTQAIDVLVNTELLRQAAYADGALVTDEQIEARYQEILTSIGGEEELKAKMVELNITEEALRKDIEGEILIQGYLSKAVDLTAVTVTEKELTDAYAQISSTAATGVTIPPLAEIKTQLEAQLKTNKEQELVNAYITELREGAEIEVLI